VMVEKEKSGDAKCNAMWVDDGQQEGFWRFSIEHGEGMWIGVTLDDKFGPGYRLKGFLYGGPGNLSGGGSLAQSGWGPSLKAGDTVDMKVTLTEDSRLIVEYGRNGLNLGTAFDIQGWEAFQGQALRPVVCLGNKGDSVSITKVTAAQEFPTEGLVPAEDDINGDWVHKDDQSYSLCIKTIEGTSARVSAKVANNMWTSVKFEQETGGGKCSVQGPVASTMMMPPPHLQQLESDVGALLGSIVSITIEEGSILVVSSSDGKREEFVRDEKMPPATKSMINWLN